MRHPHHFDPVLFDQRADAFLGAVAGPSEFAGLHQPDIDLVDDLEVAREHALEQRHTPLLERLGHQRVVGIREGAGHDRPGLVPRQALFVQQDAQQLRDRHRRVRVVEMEGNLVGEILPGILGALSVAPNDVPQ